MQFTEQVDLQRALPVPLVEIRTSEDARAYVQSIFDREMGVTLHNAKAGSKRDEAMRELTKEAANLYAGRVLRELVQNAFDGAASDPAPKILLRLDLTEGAHGTLYVANSGQGFTAENVDAISNPAMSNKTPGNFIGHKGLGFRSVELLSDDVQIYSKLSARAAQFNGFCFGFASRTDELRWLQIQNEVEFASIVVGKTHRFQLPIPIQSDVGARAIAADGFSTLVRLPLRDAIAAERAFEEMRLLVDEKAPIILFLDRLALLELDNVDADGVRTTRTLSRSGKGARSSLRGRKLTLEEVAVDKHRYLVGRMEVEEEGFRTSIEAAVGSGFRVERWREWKGAPTVSIALPRSQEARAGSFYAFLPMDAEAPFNGCLDAPFYPNTDRRGLNLTNPLNSFLLDSVADLCLAIAQTLAEATSSPEDAAAVVDAIAWSGDANRMVQACARAGIECDALRLPTVGQRSTAIRWAPLEEVFDWDDEKFRIIKGAWLVRACDIPMLRRGLGQKRTEALREFVGLINLTFEPSASNWSAWGPALASDLSTRRRKSTKQDWEDFYADLANIPSVLQHLTDKPIFRVEDGTIANANSPSTLAERELFISPDAENASRTRKRLTGTTLFPPKSIARRMLFADPNIAWSPHVTAAFVGAGLATEYSLPKVIAGMGRLLGKRPVRQTVVAALHWTFGAWKAHKSPEVEKALGVAALPVPTADGKSRPANLLRFGAGWRGTRGDLLVEFCSEINVDSRDAQSLRDSIIGPWGDWPHQDKGTLAEWIQFLRLLGVRDGLTPVYHKTMTLPVAEWWTLRRSTIRPMPIESSVGPYWREALQRPAPGFAYQSGSYSTETTLFAFPLQGEHAGMSERAKTAYARLVAAALPDLKDHLFSTVLRRTSGMSDNVHWPSPLLGFLREAKWLPLVRMDDQTWVSPREAWFAPSNDQLPRFLPRLQRHIREVIDGDPRAQSVFADRLGLRFWRERESAPARLKDLGVILRAGVADHEQDSFRSAYRDAWEDWTALDPRPAIGPGITLAIQTEGRIAPFTPDAEDTEPLFVGDGADPTLENLLVSLGHKLLSVPQVAAKNAVGALASAGFVDVRSVGDIQPRVVIDGTEINLALAHPRLVDDGRDWLAEIAVLVLEFNTGPIGRSTPRTRQLLFEDFRRLRIIQARSVQVEIDGLAGPLPSMLDGVLPVPNGERPTVIVESSGGNLDWNTLARLARGVALALDRAWLLTDFKMVFYALASTQGPLGGALARPDDEVIAKVFSQPVGRIREIQRSLRASNRRILDWLIPMVAVRFGQPAALYLIDREQSLVEDEEIVASLEELGIDAELTRPIIDACHEADGIDELRRTLAISLAAFNAATAALGPPYPQLHFEAYLRRAFMDRLEERRPALKQHVRDAFADATRDRSMLEQYADAAKLAWATFDEAWTANYDEIDDNMIDERIESLAIEALPPPTERAIESLDVLHQANRTVIMEHAERIRRLVTAWSSKVPGRSVSAIWGAKPELIAREALASGAFDFDRVSVANMPATLLLIGLWPEEMARSFELLDLGLEEEDLDQQARAEKKNRDDDDRRGKTVRFGDVDVVGGTGESLQAVVEALCDGLASRAFQMRSGPALLSPFPDGDSSIRKHGKRGTSDKDPTYLTDQQRSLIGFAGEYASYIHLKRTVRNFADDHWISSMGRSFLCLPARQDEEGYDFHVPRWRGGLYFEVKAHTGDPGYIDLERSQVAAAVQYADEKQGVWKILYVAHVLDPTSIAVHELANPFSEGNMSLYRPSSRQGVRLLIDRK